MLKLLMKEVAGPIGWGLFAFDLLDSFHGDDKQLDKLIEKGISSLDESQSLYRTGHPFAGWAVDRAAADKIGDVSEIYEQKAAKFFRVDT
ncbi:MAG: hypothetical protein P1U74_08540 [Legionellaceae bacterium]|nr:hypothetical protein [Legionellaceae bacterium]